MIKVLQRILIVLDKETVIKRKRNSIKTDYGLKALYLVIAHQPLKINR